MYERSAWPDVAELYRSQRSQVRAIVAEASAAGLDVDRTPVPACPDWDVAALTAHLAGAPAALLARSYPGDDGDAWVAGQVAARAGRTATENLDEWDRVGPDYEVLLTKNEVAWGALAYDSIAHEHDLRAAVGRPGNRTGRAVDYALDRALGQLDTKSRERGVGLQVEVGGTTWLVGDDDNVVVTVTAPSTWELVRALGSRRSADQVRELARGDVETLLALLPWGTPAERSDG